MSYGVFRAYPRLSRRLWIPSKTPAPTPATLVYRDPKLNQTAVQAHFEPANQAYYRRQAFLPGLTAVPSTSLLHSKQHEQNQKAVLQAFRQHEDDWRRYGYKPSPRRLAPLTSPLRESVAVLYNLQRRKFNPAIWTLWDPERYTPHVRPVIPYLSGTTAPSVPSAALPSPARVNYQFFETDYSPYIKKRVFTLQGLVTARTGLTFGVKSTIQSTYGVKSTITDTHGVISTITSTFGVKSDIS